MWCFMKTLKLCSMDRITNDKMVEKRKWRTIRYVLRYGDLLGLIIKRYKNKTTKKGHIYLINNNEFRMQFVPINLKKKKQIMKNNCCKPILRLNTIRKKNVKEHKKVCTNHEI